MHKLSHLPHAFALMLAWIVVMSNAGAADFATGMSAYEKGDYDTALKQWVPVAKEGIPMHCWPWGSSFNPAREFPEIW